MGTGISMSSVNKIKELAESGDYSLALDILEHQDLTKSLSPQFIRICGEVYYENGRYVEARKALVKAHSMAPMGNKIVFSIIKLYLSLGLYDLADKYEEIYKYNQSERDAGQYRIEYLKAKANRKPVSELISILISANDIETNEAWDYEMILLYSMQGNKDKLKIACEDFLAMHKGSSKKEQVERILAGDYDVEDEIYCYGSAKTEEDYPDMQEIKEFEDGILDEDYLRIHPKDPKIMIMVEDNAPVTNSMKFKQMIVKNKDKREAKKLKKEQEKGEKKGLFGRGISKKDEEAYEDVIDELEAEGVDKEALLDEITGASDEDVHEILPDDTDVEEDESEAVEEVADEPEDIKVSNDSDSFDTATEDFDVEDEPEPDMIIMIDPEDDADMEQEEETAEPVDMEQEEESISDIPDAVIVSEEAETVEDFALEEAKTVEAVFEEVEDDEYVEFAEPAETAEDSESSDATDEFNFDTAFESLDEYDIHSEETEEELEELTDLEENNEIEDIEAIKELEEIAETEEVEEVTEVEEIAEVEEAAVIEEIEEPEEIETDATEEMETDVTDEYEEEINPDETYIDADDDDIDAAVELEPEFDFEPEFEFDAEDDEEPETTVISAEDEAEPGVEVVEETQPDLKIEAGEEMQPEPEVEEEEELQSEPDVEDVETEEVQPEPEVEAEEAVQMEPVRRKMDFPVFKSSLFPDYNNEEAPVFEEKVVHKGIDEKKEEEIRNNLKEEEQLLHETDLLLARLGIELGTDLLGGNASKTSDDIGEVKRDIDTTSKQNVVSGEKDNPFKLKK